MTRLETAIGDLAREHATRETWDVPLDYFSWGRDQRHQVDDTETLPEAPVEVEAPKKVGLGQRLRGLLGGDRSAAQVRSILRAYKKSYAAFDETYQLMSDAPSRDLFAELVYIKLVSEESMRLSSFTQEFIDSYEQASARILESEDTLPVYRWVLRKVVLEDPLVTFYTNPTVLNLHLSGRLYRYAAAGATVGVEPGDTVLDAGVGWGDTTVYLATRAGTSGRLIAFDILEEGLAALARQIEANPALSTITPVLRGLSDQDGAEVRISAPGPDAKITESAADESEAGSSGSDLGRIVKTTTIDAYVEREGLERVDFIKMDIEGAEVPALRGGAETIRRHKPKLAISAYHKWDDLLVIPRLIHSIRDDYRFYLDCTTGFGGETVLYCR